VGGEGDKRTKRHAAWSFPFEQWLNNGGLTNAQRLAETSSRIFSADEQAARRQMRHPAVPPATPPSVAIERED